MKLLPVPGVTLLLLLIVASPSESFPMKPLRLKIVSGSTPFRILTASARSLHAKSLPGGDELDELQLNISKMSGGTVLNVNSPKQVSQAIFGSPQSTSRKFLLEASSETSGLDQQKRSLAKMVLKYRQLQSLANREQSTLASLSGDFDEDEGDIDVLTESLLNSAEASNQEFTPLLNNDESAITRTNHPQHSPYDVTVESLFGKKSKIHLYWKSALEVVTKPSARSMVQQLNSLQCPMGYDPLAVPHDILRGTTTEIATTTTAGKRGSLLAYVREQKERFPECVLLVRVGEFYESFGVDAVMLVEHCGLNAMAGKARAGCPVRNIQATLDCLTNQGFKVAVYEEATDTDASRGPGSKTRLKNRMLGQIVSSASPTYLYDLVLAGNLDTLAVTQESRPYVGIISSSMGYTMVEVSLEERSVKVSERLTPEAVSCRLTAYPPVDPLLYVGDEDTRFLPFLPPSSCGSRTRIKAFPLSLVESHASGVSSIERAKRIVVRALLGVVERDEATKLTDDGFQLISTEATSKDSGTRTRPLYVETATQLGLMNDRAIPPLVNYLLPESAPAACRRFLRRWLLTPPPAQVSVAMAGLVTIMQTDRQPLPPVSVPPVGKVVALLRSGQASAYVYSELLSALDSTLRALDNHLWVDPMMILLEYESGIAADVASIKSRCSKAVCIIEDIVSPLHHVVKSDFEYDQVSNYGDLIPRAFFERNEAPWRGRVKPQVCREVYGRVEMCARALAIAVAQDFWGFDDQDQGKLVEKAAKTKSPIVQDVFNNIFAIKTVPEHGKDSDFFHPRDRNGKLLRNRYTSALVQSTLSEYVSACEAACQDVTGALTSLSAKLCDEGHLPALVQAAHFNLVIATAAQHVSRAKLQGWSLARVMDRENEESAARMSEVWPYWMDKSASVSNSFDLDGLFLLTAPNMSGKSTLMRSTAAAALLASCGLCAPLGDGSVIRRFDHLFVRGASSDIPTENLSAFGAEVLDIAALLRVCTKDSLVFVDELGRGTSPRDGTSIAAAVIEAMAESGMSGIFATHLHDMFKLPLRGSDRVKCKRMGLLQHNETLQPSYLIESGVCLDSMALYTAAQFGFPPSVLERAQEFSQMIDAGVVPLQQEQPNYRHKMNLTPTQHHGSKSLSEALQVITLVKGCEGTPISIPPGWNPPPSIAEGCSCLYIIELAESSPRLYVGETDALSKRLNQHRRKGGSWAEASTMVFPIQGGKSHARSVESLVIKELSKAGFHLVSIADGKSTRSSLQ